MLARLIARQRGHLFPWVPVCLGLGIGLYFALPVEPAVWLRWGLVTGAALLLVLLRRMGETVAPLAGALALVALGIGWAGMRTADMAAPVLSFRYYGPIEGRVVEIDRSLSEKSRITLDQVVLTDTAPGRTPVMVRVSLHGDGPFAPLEPGARVILTGHLSPPMGPAEPGGFDFRRMAWFERLGAVGYSRTPVLLLEPAATDSLALRITAARMALSEAIRAAVPGQAGAFAAAVSTGDRSGLGRDTLDAMRASNLAHLIAISGLHMGLLTGLVFVSLCTGIALWPALALRVDARKWAAVLAFVAATGYLALSGGSIATQRAYLMVAVMLTAVLMDRRAISLRSVAVAAIAILIWRPEALTSPGFQMSFAATTALVWVYRGMSGGPLWRAPRWALPVLTLALSSAVAGLATAPVGAAHFNMVARYGLIANLAAVPVMGLLVMPAAIVAALLAPLGLAGPALWAMGAGCTWILEVASRVAALDGAVVGVTAPGPLVLPVLCLGMLWVMLWQGRGRLVGAVSVVVALWVWHGAERPPVLVAASGGLVGVMGPEGRVLSKPRGDGFAARSWLENDGDRRLPASAAGPLPETGFAIVTLTEAKLRDAAEPCRRGDLLVTTARKVPPGLPCLVLDARLLADTGSVALWPGGDGLRLETAAEYAGHRPWSGPVPQTPALPRLRLAADQ